MSRSLRLAIAALALAALLAGCGGDDGGDPAAADASGDAAADVTAPTDAADDGGDAEDEPGDEGGDEAAAGAIPDACGLVTDDERDALVPGAEVEQEDDTAIDGLDYSQCTWESGDAMVIVAVVEGPSRHEMHRDNLPGEPVDGIGESAIVAPGISSETRAATGGRTVSALVDGNTLVVAVRLTGETTDDDVVPLATTIAERLPAA